MICPQEVYGESRDEPIMQFKSNWPKIKQVCNYFNQSPVQRAIGFAANLMLVYSEVSLILANGAYFQVSVDRIAVSARSLEVNSPILSSRGTVVLHVHCCILCWN